MALASLTEIAASSGLKLDREAVLAVERRFNATARHDARLRRGIWIGIALMIVSGLTIGIAAVRLGGLLGLAPPWDNVLGAILTPLTLIIVWFAVIPRVTRPAIRRALRACGHDVCERCGYVLHGLEDGAACPECGQRKQSPLGPPGGGDDAGVADAADGD